MSSTRFGPLCIAMLLAILFQAGRADARDLGDFDVNVRAIKPQALKPQAASAQAAITPVALGQGSDGLGRATFTWVQQALPAAAKARSADPEATARAHLALLLSAAKRQDPTAHSLSLRKVDAQSGGATLVQFRTEIDGVAIFHEDLALLLDAEQRLVAMRGPLPNVDASPAKSLPKFSLDAAAAIALALRGYDFSADVAQRLRPAQRHGEYQQFELDAQSRSDSGAIVRSLRAKRVYFRTSNGVVPAWYVETRVSDAADAAADPYAHVISAVDGSTLFRTRQEAHLDSFNYRVWAENDSDHTPLPSPEGRANTPDADGLPGNNVVPFLAKELRSLANAPFSRSATDPWLPAGATSTSGNNVDAFVDVVAPNGFNAGDLRPTLTAPLTFDYPFDLNIDPDANPIQRQSAAVQLFYWLNWLHDRFYDHGFAEADGNAQVDNFGRGGVGGDAIIAEAQNLGLGYNGLTDTPADGAPPRIELGLFQRDPDGDGTIVAHEWAHYLSNRLIGDGSGLQTQHARAMGEGWSDFVALLVLVKDEDRLRPDNANFSGPYGHAGYASGDSFYGNRRYPYSTQLTKNPLSLRYIVEGVALPTTPPANPRILDISNSQVHNQGQTWASAVWECYANLLNDRPRLSFADAQSRMMDYLVGGMKLTPVNPTMIEGRDAILATILAAGQNEDFAACSAGFAKRGLGAGAIIPDRYNVLNTGTIESTAVGASLAVASMRMGLPDGCDEDAVLDVGETAKVTIELANGGFAAVTSGTLTLTSNRPALTFPGGSTVNVGTIPAFGRVSVNIPVRLSSAVSSFTGITLTATPNAPGTNTSGAMNILTQFDEVPRTSSSEVFLAANSGWSFLPPTTGNGSEPWRQINGDRDYLRGEDSNFSTVIWAQTPPMSVGSGPLTLTLKHRYALESSDGVNFDGGVIQTSIDGGASWTDVDPNSAGYAPSPLSNCCGNPLAGHRAYSGVSPGYPSVSDFSINLGTAYANQSNFRLRFGVATDVGVRFGGWEIFGIEIGGLLDTPFTSTPAQAPTCSVSEGKTLQGAMSGTYYSPSRSGEGVLVDFGQVGGTPVVFFTWYTYGSGTQQWLVGSNTFAETDRRVVIDLINTSGASFGSGFRPADVARNPWGSVALSFPTCDTMTLTYHKTNGETATQTLSRVLGRLDAGQCNLLQGGLSGTYYSASRSGEGVLVDFGKVGATPVEFFTWYTYGAGTQQWLVGSQSFAPNDSTVTVDLINTSGAGFGNAFRPQSVVRSPWGRVTQRFIDCNTLELSYQKTGGESGTQVLTRALGRLGDGQCH